MLKKYLLHLIGVFVFLCLNKASAQELKDTADYPYYIDMMRYDTVNFFKVQRAFNLYYAKHHVEDEHDADNDEVAENEEDEGFALYKRWEYMTKKRIRRDGTRIPLSQTAREIDRYKRTHPDK